MKNAAPAAFVLAIVLLSWHGMMALHELGHVAGALVTDGHVKRVVLHPLKISQTDVNPNPHPGIVVWLGPLIGCLLPLVAALLATRVRRISERAGSCSSHAGSIARIARFFAGFCLIANGAYLVFGTAGEIGDCGELLRTGTPVWILYVFGGMTIPAGLYCWHRLGPVRRFFKEPPGSIPLIAVWVLLAAVFALELLFGG